MKNLHKIDLDEVYGIWFVPWWQQVPIYKLLVVIFVITITFILFVMWVRFLRYQYWYTARKKIKFLIDQHKHQKIRASELYRELLHELKQFIEIRYELAATSLTDYELLYLLKNRDTINHADLLTAVIVHAETIKFGTYNPINNQEIQEDLNHALRFIEQSKPKKLYV